MRGRERHAFLGRWVPLRPEASTRDPLVWDMEKTGAAGRRLIVEDLSEEWESALIDFPFDCDPTAPRPC